MDGNGYVKVMGRIGVGGGNWQLEDSRVEWRFLDVSDHLVLYLVLILLRR